MIEKIIVLDHLWDQFRDRTISTQVKKQIKNEYYYLAGVQAQGGNSVQDYLTKKNGKKMKGADKIFKYRLSDGDRILYTYGYSIRFYMRSMGKKRGEYTRQLVYTADNHITAGFGGEIIL